MPASLISIEISSWGVLIISCHFTNLLMILRNKIVMDKRKATIHKISLILTLYLKHSFVLEIILNKYANQIFSLLYNILLAAVAIVYRAQENIYIRQVK